MTANPVWRRVDRVVLALLATSPYTRVIGLARTVVATATAVALAATPARHLFYVGENRPTGRVCEGIAASIGLFCRTPGEYLDVARWVAVALLVVVASGWRPRFTAPVHWWISFSFFTTSNVFDGGDQVAAVLTLLLLPIALTDPRRWHWDAAPDPGELGQVRQVVAHLALRLVWLQAAVLYFHASVGKLGGTEWQDGTSVWYWLGSGPFGAPAAFDEPVRWLLSHGWAVQAATWGTLAVEFLLACCLAAGYAVRRALLPIGLVLHLSIAVAMGLPAFSAIMCALLLLYLQRPGDPSNLGRDVVRAWSRVRADDEPRSRSREGVSQS